MQSRSPLADYYARRAAEYEAIYAKPERQEELAALRAKLATVFAGRSVLEVACGTGYWTAVIAPEARSVLACDCNEEVLALARTKPAPRTTFLRADAYALPTVWAPHDAGFAAFWWSHVPKARLPDFLAGFHAALSPGAKIVFIDNRYVEGSSTPLSRTDAAGNTYQSRRLRDGSVHEVLKNFPTSAELHATLTAAGARDLQLDLGHYYWRVSYRR